ncbi:MAG: aminoacyl-tRNA hydrolase [Oscillospiraceae bacterium]|nr:aminoacyl-tRNA hydrolase [Oscillospiraceae bacterium]
MLFRRSSCDYLIVGLGNPGAQYEKTRHNVGFRALDALAREAGAKPDRAKFQALTCLCDVGGLRALLLKPQTFMNNSGLAVRQAADYYKLPPERVLVLFDDVDLDVGRLRIRRDGSAGGHNGVKSIISCMGSQAFPRIKIGVGAKPHPDYDLADWVLSRFSARELELLDPAIERAASAAQVILREGLERASSLFNGK